MNDSPLPPPLFSDSSSYWGGFNVIPVPETMGGGEISLSPNGDVVLRVVADWSGFHDDSGQLAGVHGLVRDDRKLTLYDLLEEPDWSDEFCRAYRVGQVASRGRLFNLSETPLIRYRLRLAGLTAFLVRGHFRAHGDDPYSGPLNTANLPVHDDSDSHDVPGHGLTLRFGGTVEPWFEMERVQWDTITWVDLIPSEPRPVTEMVDLGKQLRRFLSVLSGRGYAETYAWGEPVGEDSESTVEFFRSYQLEARGASEAAEAITMFDYHDLKPRIGQMFANWLDESPELDPVHDLLHSDGLGHGATPTRTFLTNTQAAEAYMRVSSADTVVPEAAFTEALGTVADALGAVADAQLRNVLLGRLRHANEPSFRRRLRALLDSLPDDLRDAFTRSPREFAELVVSTRNALTHVGTGTPPGLQSEPERMVASELLRLAVFSAIAIRIGADGGQILSRLRDSHWFRFLSAMSPGSPALD